MIERITALRDAGLNRSQVMKQIGMCYEKFHRLLRENKLDFPIVPRRYRNGLADQYKMERMT